MELIFLTSLPFKLQSLDPKRFSLYKGLEENEALIWTRPQAPRWLYVFGRGSLWEPRLDLCEQLP